MWIPVSEQEQLRYESGCLGKERFSSESAAEAAAKFYHEQRMTRGMRQQAYQCVFSDRLGNHWHLSHEA